MQSEQVNAVKPTCPSSKGSCRGRIASAFRLTGASPGRLRIGSMSQPSKTELGTKWGLRRRST
ncbi:hypothetical protein Pyn_38184 [Prunus yedoensis var. nudiflora]|uniref:Uncharacterized protein n=1 Tax=Prunus yedoensis var. nudiflora TaxID=2094558 RepID=A0A314YWQ1_PRUYE|nr:hypothetical protein Pyn_38184 [Prunus yedoensis var. nudiflora]